MAHILSEGFDWAANSSDLAVRWNAGTGGSPSTTTAFGTGRSWIPSGTPIIDLGVNYSEIFGSVRVRCDGTDRAFLYFYDGGTQQVSLRIDTATGTTSLRRGNQDGTTIGSVYGPISAFWQSWQFRIVFHNTTGVFELRRNGATTNMISLSGQNTRSTANNYFNRFGFACTNTCYIDDIWLNDTTGASNNSWCGDIRVITQVPTGAGSSTQFTPSTGSNWQCVDDMPNNGETDYVQSSTVGHKDLYAMSALGSTAGTIRGVNVFGMVKKMDAGARTAGIRHVSGATESTLVSSDALSSSYMLMSSHQALDPNTGLAWTQSGVESQQIGPIVVA